MLTEQVLPGEVDQSEQIVPLRPPPLRRIRVVVEAELVLTDAMFGRGASARTVQTHDDRLGPAGRPQEHGNEPEAAVGPVGQCRIGKDLLRRPFVVVEEGSGRRLSSDLRWREPPDRAIHPQAEALQLAKEIRPQFPPSAMALRV